MSDQTPEHATSDYVVLCAEDIERLIPFGCVRETRAAQPLFEAGDESTAFFVVLGGTVDILSANPSGPKLITTHVAGQFLGELNLLIGQRPFVSAVVAEPGSVLAIDLTVFRDIMRTMPDLSDIVFKEFVARRTHTIEGSGVNAIRIIGTRFRRERWLCEFSPRDRRCLTCGSTSTNLTNRPCSSKRSASILPGFLW